MKKVILATMVTVASMGAVADRWAELTPGTYFSVGKQLVEKYGITPEAARFAIEESDANNDHMINEGELYWLEDGVTIPNGIKKSKPTVTECHKNDDGFKWTCKNGDTTTYIGTATHDKVRNEITFKNGRSYNDKSRPVIKQKIYERYRYTITTKFLYTKYKDGVAHNQYRQEAESDNNYFKEVGGQFEAYHKAVDKMEEHIYRQNKTEIDKVRAAAKMEAEKEAEQEAAEAANSKKVLAALFILICILVVATEPSRKRRKAEWEAQRIAEEKHREEEAEKERIAKEKKRIADEAAARKKSIAKIRAARKKRIAEEEAAEAQRIAEEEAAEAERLIQEQAALAKEKLESDIANLTASLPFYTRKHDESQWKFNGDEMRWNDVVSAIVNDNKFKTTIYLVKVRSLFDDSEHYKVGVTTSNVADRFLKSPDVELLEIITKREIENRCALFAEFHFIREFRISNNPKDKTFSGYTEVIKGNSVRKITSLFTHLDDFETKSKSFLNIGLEFNNKEK